jgi:hypothetical protein
MCGNLPQCKTDNSQRVAKVGDVYTLQIVVWEPPTMQTEVHTVAWPRNIYTGATQQVATAKTRVVTG